MAAIVRPRFYPIIALVLAVVVFIGFARTFYLGFLFQAPSHSTLVVLHGFAFTAWVLLFIVQTRLIAANRLREHMSLGLFGVGLAVVVFVLGVMTAIASITVDRPHPLGLNGAQFSIVPFTAIGLYGVCVACAIAYRRRAALHKRFMMLAMIAVIAPAVARLAVLVGAEAYLAAIQVGTTAGLVIACLAYDWSRNKIFHPVYTIGGAVLILSWPLRIMVAQTHTWERIALAISQ